MPGRPGAGAMGAGKQRRNIPPVVKQRKNQNETSQEELRSTASRVFGPHKGDPEDVAAMVLQRAALKKLIGHDCIFKRDALLERLHLEIKLMRGLRLLVLCVCMFAVVIFAAIHEKQGSTRLGLLNTYKSLFQLDDSLAEIKTINDLFAYLRMVSVQSRLIQPTSSEYFVETAGELKLMQNVRSFESAEAIEKLELVPRIDSPEFSLMAWVQLDEGTGKHILRKPLGKTPDQRALNCYSWYVGMPAERIEFGAHDCGRTDTLQETVTGISPSNVADGRLHNVALVVTQNMAAFYMDALFQWNQTLSRPITDCSGTELILGDEHIPTLGEITFFARALTAEEIKDIMGSGFTLSSIAAGKLPFSPKETSFDNAAWHTDQAFASANSERATMSASLQVEATLTRQVAGDMTATSGPAGASTSSPSSSATAYTSNELKIAVNRSAPCVRVLALGDDTSCRIMKLEEADSEEDSETGRAFFGLIQPEYFPVDASGNRLGPRERVLLDHNHPQEMLSYDSSKFPTFCGRSATFSIWWESSTDAGGTVLSRHQSAGDLWRSHFYSLHVNPYGCSLYGRKAKTSLHRTSSLPESFEMPLAEMKSGTARHVAFVLDKNADSLQFFLDGHLLGTHKYPEGYVGEMDCGMDQAGAYTGLGHRLPGASAPVGAVQDWRYYRAALNASEIQRLAYNSSDHTGRRLRTCVLPHEAWDQNWEDLDGRDCAWFHEQRKVLPKICVSAAVRKYCPIACMSKPPCWQGSEENTAGHSVWNRVMFLTETKRGAGVICAREGIDVVEECRVYKSFINSNPAASDPSTANNGGGMGSWWTSFYRSYMDIDVDNCEVLARAWNPYCSFAVPGAWSRNINAEISRNGGYTMSFWWKALEGTNIPSSDAEYQANTESQRRFVFFSQVSPPRVILTIEVRRVLVEARFFGSCVENEVQEVEISASHGLYRTGKWNHLAAVFGAVDTAGKRSVMLMFGVKSRFERADFKWCLDANKDFIQGIQAPGNIIMSPIQVVSKPLAVAQIQKRFYEAIPKFRLRRGPLTDDLQRMKSTISYERSTYSYHMSLVAPPILLQTRDSKTEICDHELGTIFHEKTWTDTIKGRTCSLPYECDEDLRNRSTALLACSVAKSPSSFFGHRPIQIGGQTQFYEFLQSITDASILVRDRKPLETSGYLDAQTKSISVVMVAYAPNFGIASTISISASLGSDVSVDFDVQHFQSLEGENLETYKNICIIGFMLACVILIEKVITFLHKDTTRTKVRLGLAVDCLVQVILPVVYFAVRYVQVAASSDQILEMVGDQGFGGVPWSSRDEPFDNKITSYFSAIRRFQDKLSTEKIMQAFYYIHDLWHFFILFFLIQIGFIFLAVAQFSDTKAEFADWRSSFEALWDMFLGSMIESGDIPSSMWSSNFVLMIFLLMYNIIIFMSMLNFIIAIIIDAYMKVVMAAKITEADQEFFTDVLSIVNVSIKSCVFYWPSHLRLLEQIGMLKTTRIDYIILRRIFADKSRRTLLNMFTHYSRYKHMHYVKAQQKYATPEAEEMSHVIDELTRRMSVMIGTPVPTEAELIMEHKRLTMIGDHERLHRLMSLNAEGKFRKKGVLRSKPLIPPSIIPKHTDSYVVHDLELSRPANVCVNSEHALDSEGHQPAWSRHGGHSVNLKAGREMSRLSEQVERLEIMLLQMSGAEPSPARRQVSPNPKIKLVSLKEPLEEIQDEGRLGRGGGGPADMQKSTDTYTVSSTNAHILPDSHKPDLTEKETAGVKYMGKNTLESVEPKQDQSETRPSSVEISQEPRSSRVSFRTAPDVTRAEATPSFPTTSSRFYESMNDLNHEVGRNSSKDFQIKSLDMRPAGPLISALKGGGRGRLVNMAENGGAWQGENECQEIEGTRINATLLFDDVNINEPPRTPLPPTPSSSSPHPERSPFENISDRGSQYAARQRSSSPQSSSSSNTSAIVTNLSSLSQEQGNFMTGAVNFFNDRIADISALATPRGTTAAAQPQQDLSADVRRANASDLWDVVLRGTDTTPHRHSTSEHQASGIISIPLAGYSRVDTEYGEG